MKESLQKTERDLLREMKQGKYQDSYLVYNRKSTDEADIQKNSISFQKHENSRYALGNNLPLAGITIKGFSKDGFVSEKHSGFKEDNTISFTKDGLVQFSIDRPKFLRLVQYLNQGYFKGIICLCWDRLSRNKADDTIIKKLMKSGVDIHFVYARYDNTSAGALHMDIDGMFSQHHSRVTSEKVKIATRNSRQKGICTYRAPMGYLNTGKMEHKPFDPNRAPIIRELFNLYATGNWSLSDLARHANQQGLTTLPQRRPRTKEEMLDEDLDIKDIPKVSRPLTENHISRILSNRFYIGQIKDGNGGYIQSISHKPLVSKELFHEVQAKLGGNQVSKHYTNKLQLPLRGVIRCSHCNRAFTPYVKKGILYYSSRCRKGCTNNLCNINFRFISDWLSEKISQLYFTHEEQAQIEKTFDNQVEYLTQEKETVLKQFERKTKKLQDDLSYLRDNKLELLRAGTFSPEEMKQREDELNQKLIDLEENQSQSLVDLRETVQDTFKVSELMKSIAIYYRMATDEEKSGIFEKLFSELYVSHLGLEYKANPEIEVLESRLQALGDPKDWLSELEQSKEHIDKLLLSLGSLNILELEPDRPS